jgi:hypothetical protein
MILKPPFEITSRLMAGVRVGGATLSIEDNGDVSYDNRTVYNIWIDLPDGQEFNVTDLRSGCGGGSLQEGMCSLLSFLGAAGESYNYSRINGENSDLFLLPVVEWAAQNSDELSMLSCELEEQKDLILEN